MPGPDRSAPEQLTANKQSVVAATPDLNGPLLTVKQTAALLHKSRGGVLLWIRQGRLGHIRLGQALRIPRSEVEGLLRRCWVPRTGQRP
jgi:excisionase family DNA binding protein